MKNEDRRRIFNFLKENAINKKDNEVDYIIDFENGEMFHIDDIDELYATYNKMEEELDNVSDFNKIVSVEPFKSWSEQGFINYDQATMIEFNDYALKALNKIGG